MCDTHIFEKKLRMEMAALFTKLKFLFLENLTHFYIRWFIVMTIFYTVEYYFISKASKKKGLFIFLYFEEYNFILIKTFTISLLPILKKKKYFYGTRIKFKGIC